MSSFIESTDYDASIHSEILDAITRNDPAIITIAEDRAIEEIKGYLSSRYKVNEIFSATGNSRNKLIVMFCLDIVLYHLHSAHNPLKMPQNRKDRYDRAIAWLRQVQRGDVEPQGLPIISDQEVHGHIQFGSNQKRVNHF